MSKNSEFKIHQVKHLEQLTTAFEFGLVKLYQEIFAEPPYIELFSNDEVIKLFINYVTVGILLLIYLNKEVIGFCANVPFQESAICEERIEESNNSCQILSPAYLKKSFGFNPEQTWYMADLGVSKTWRRHGLARWLVQSSFNILPPNTENLLLDTSEQSPEVQLFYSSLGFQTVVGKARNVSQIRQNGCLQIDRRIFMYKINRMSS